MTTDLLPVLTGGLAAAAPLVAALACCEGAEVVTGSLLTAGFVDLASTVGAGAFLGSSWPCTLWRGTAFLVPGLVTNSIRFC